LRLTATVGELTNELGRSPTLQEIAEQLEVDQEAVLEAMEANRAYATHSLDAQLPGEDRSLGDTLGGDEPGMDNVERQIVVEDLLQTLPEREQAILRLRFFDGLTQTEIAARVGISQMHVSRLLARSLETLRRTAGGGAVV
jgi:RNA polymerase sigma-B factor